MTREQKQHILHFAVSSLGGFMGGYAIFNHCDVFGITLTDEQSARIFAPLTQAGKLSVK